LNPKKEEGKQIEKQVREVRVDKSRANKTPIFVSVLNPVRVHEHFPHQVWLLPSHQGNNNRHSDKYNRDHIRTKLR
jgi:hypothetical protein